MCVPTGFERVDVESDSEKDGLGRRKESVPSLDVMSDFEKGQLRGGEIKSVYNNGYSENTKIEEEP